MPLIEPYPKNNPWNKPRPLASLTSWSKSLKSYWTCRILAWQIHLDSDSEPEDTPPPPRLRTSTRIEQQLNNLTRISQENLHQTAAEPLQNPEPVLTLKDLEPPEPMAQQLQAGDPLVILQVELEAFQ